MAIQTFLCTDTESLYQGNRVARWVNIERVALRKLTQLVVSGDWMTCADLLVTALSDCEVTERGNTASASTTSGGSVLCGPMTVPMVWKSSTTIDSRS